MAAETDVVCEIIKSAAVILAAEGPISIPEDDDSFIAAAVCRRNNKRVKINSFCDDVVPYYSGADFQSHFRLTRSSAEKLLNLITPALAYKRGKTGRVPMSAERVMLMSLWLLATNVTFRDVADRFGMSKGHAHRKFMQFVSAIERLGPQFISFPRGEEAVRAVRNFELLRNRPFPGVIGCIDGTHIQIPAPEVDRGSYFNRKGTYSVLLQVVCGYDLKFIDVYSGWPGSCHDARVWRMSPLYNALTSNDNFLDRNFHLLGDSAYPVDNFLLAPYRDNGHLTQSQRRFNARLSSVRVTVEQAIGLLKNRFRRLKYLDMARVDAVGRIIYVCCILHNICLHFRDDLPIELAPPENEDNVFDIGMEANAGIRKRQELADIFMAE